MESHAHWSIRIFFLWLAIIIVICTWWAFRPGKGLGLMPWRERFPFILGMFLVAGYFLYTGITL